MSVFRHCILFLLILAGVAVSGWAQTTTSEGFFLIKQGDFSQPLYPFRQSNSALIFYNFNNDQSNTGFEVPERSLIMLHVDQLTNQVSLVLIHSSAQNPAGGSVSFSIDGLPTGATLDLTDDASDSFVFSPPTLQASWQWLPEHDDGVIIGNLGQDFQITITPNFISGVVGWDYVDGQTQIPSPLPNMVEPVTIIGTLNSPPVAHFTVSPATLNINVGVTFDASGSSDTDGRIVRYEWDFDGDGVFEVSSTRPSVQHVFVQGGTVRVTLRVTDDTGGITTFTQTFVIAEEIVSAMRSISTPQAVPGLPFRVTVELNMRADINGLGLDESLPPGWEVTPIDNAGATFKRSENQWIFPSILRAGEVRRIVYDVTIHQDSTGAGPLPADLAIRGSVDSAAPAFRAPVSGEDALEVTSCLSIPVALAHMDPNTDIVDLRSSEQITFDQVQRAVTFWIEEVGVPQTCDALVNLDALKELTARQLLNVPVDETLDHISFTNGASPTVTRRILTPLPFYQLYLQARGGDLFRVEIEITADQDYHGFAIGENLPETWALRPLDNNGAAFNPRTRQWLFTTDILSGDVRKLIYEVVVPSDETVGAFSITGSAGSRAPTFQSSIDQDEGLEIVECLAIPVAVAHLNVETEAIDIALSNQVSFGQIQVAIAYWLEDQEVIGTCGKTIDFDVMKSLIAYWLTDTSVDKPLGGSFEDEGF